MTSIYKPVSTTTGGFGFGRERPVDMARCRVQVYEPVSRNFCQCSRKAAIEVEGIGYCKQHSPAERAKRDAAREAKWAAEAARLKRRHERPADYTKALRAIAAGHNDPRALAIEVLTKWGGQS